MTSRHMTPDEGPELVPPAELLRLRAALARPPRPELRAQHLVATVMAARQRGHSPMGRFASRSARAGFAIVAALAITSGLAGAQLLPEQAQRLLSNVSDRFAPAESDPPAEPATPGDGTTTVRSAPSGPAQDDEMRADVTTSTTITTEEPVAGPGTTADTSATTAPPPPPPPSTTIPGPAGPGSPDDPTDPDPTTTTTAPPTTTTTVPPTTTTTTPPPTTTTTPPGGGRR